MRRRQRQVAHVSHERWLVSYADFITLLFAVFVVLYASAHVDNKRIGELSHAIKDAFKDLGVFQTANAKAPVENLQLLTSTNQDPADSSGESSADTTDLRKLLSSALAPEIKKKQAELRDGPDGLVISLQEIGFYDQGSDVLTEASTGTLNRVASVLKPTKLRIRIEGHTDNVGSKAENSLLSLHRASAVATYLSGRGVKKARFTSMGMADTHPLVPNDTEANRAKNRRTGSRCAGATRALPISLVPVSIHSAVICARC